MDNEPKCGRFGRHGLLAECEDCLCSESCRLIKSYDANQLRRSKRIYSRMSQLYESARNWEAVEMSIQIDESDIELLHVDVIKCHDLYQLGYLTGEIARVTGFSLSKVKRDIKTAGDFIR